MARGRRTGRASADGRWLGTTMLSQAIQYSHKGKVELDWREEVAHSPDPLQ